jgi:hypothetical protein
MPLLATVTPGATVSVSLLLNTMPLLTLVLLVIVVALPDITSSPKKPSICLFRGRRV